jgi:HEAT repeat protein
MNNLRLILIGFIIFIFCLIFTSVLISVTRRVRNKRRYEKLDRLREKFRPEILKIITSGSIGRFVHNATIRSGSLEWIALEGILLELCEQEGPKTHARKLLEILGYTKHYHDQLLSRGSFIRLSAATDKLGRIGAPSAVEPLFRLLGHKESEVATVAVRALCRIGTGNALQRVLDALPALLKDGNVTVKAIQTSLLLFGPWAGEVLLQYAGKTEDPKMIAVILETLISFPGSREMFEFALAKLSHPDSEVRGKALRALALGESQSFPYDPQVFLPLLNDPVWFVRLQAAKTIGKLRCDHFIEMLKKLALDERWQVRDAATFSLVEIGDASLDAFLELLETPDRYAKEGISEEIQRTGYILDLIEYLGGADLERKAKTVRILTSMHQVGFSTPLREALETGKNRPEISVELMKILQTGGVA